MEWLGYLFVGIIVALPTAGVIALGIALFDKVNQGLKRIVSDEAPLGFEEPIYQRRFMVISLNEGGTKLGVYQGKVLRPLLNMQPAR